MDAVVQRDVVQRLDVDVAREDDDGRRPIERLSQRQRDLHAVQSARKVIVAQNDVGGESAGLDQPDRRRAVDGGRHRVALFGE